MMKISLPQLAVLRAAKAGCVYRSERGHDLYACYNRAGNGNKKVTAIVERLSALGLLRIGEQAGMERPWHVTEQGAKLLAQEVAS